MKKSRILAFGLILIFLGSLSFFWRIPVKADTPPPVVFNEEGKITREYKWEYNNQKWTWTLTVTEAKYKYFKDLERLKTSDYSFYVSNPHDDIFIKSLVTSLKKAQIENGFSDRQLVDFTVAFVQSLPYYYDIESTGYDNYPKYPLETLVENGGDCEDTSILMVSLLKEMGYGSVLILLPKHMAVGVKGSDDMDGTYYEYKGAKYYYLETTGERWTIGKIPKEFIGKQSSIFSLEQKPLITHSWKVLKEKGNKLSVEIKNKGTKAANKCSVYVAFDAGNGKVYNQIVSDSFNVEVGKTYTCELNLKYPKKVKTRLIIKILYNGETIGTSYSKWFKTN